jgi:hypothetical protein
MRVGVVIAVRLREIHWWEPLVAETEGAQCVVFPLDGLMKVHHGRQSDRDWSEVVIVVASGGNRSVWL